MNEEKAREILGDCISTTNELYAGLEYISWATGYTHACLDGHYTADELEAIAWWMRNKK